MGNCQAIDAAALVIQHPCGRIERMYWPVLASEIMSLNPGHYVSLIIPLSDHNLPAPSPAETTPTAVQYTRVKLLRPSHTLALGHAYRLVPTQEVVRVLRAKKCAKVKQQLQEAETDGKKSEIVVLDKHKSSDSEAAGESESEKSFQFQATKQVRPRRRAPPVNLNPVVLRSKSWRPTLQSITESTS